MGRFAGQTSDIRYCYGEFSMTRLQALKEKLRAAKIELRIRQREANMSSRALEKIQHIITTLEARIAYLEKS